MMNNANQSAALFYHLWWWFIPPGVVLTGMVAALLIAERGPRRGLQPEAEGAMSVSVENLSVAYRSRRGDVTAVDSVSFTLADGEIMGLAGESGSGKSTLGNALIYLDQRMKQTGGKVTLDGKELPIADTKAMRPLRMTEVSLVPQYAMNALTPTRKIGRLITDLLKSHGIRNRAEVLTEMNRRIELIGLKEDVLGKYPFELSGGMRQRVTIIMSTLLEPVAAHRRRGHLRARRIHAARGGRDADRVPRPRVRQERHRDHPRPGDPGADRRHASRSCTRAGSPRRPAPTRS